MNPISLSSYHFFHVVLLQHLLLEASVVNPLRPSLQNSVSIDNELAVSTSSLADMALSPESKRKWYKPEECEDCGHRVYKRGVRSKKATYCNCTA